MAYIDKISPTGFHILTIAEMELIQAAFTGGALKVTGFEYWNDPNTGATNETGFSAIGVGVRGADTGLFMGDKKQAMFWLADSYDDTKAGAFTLANGNDLLSITDQWNKGEGLSVRLAMDDPSLYTPGMTVTDADGNSYNLVKIHLADEVQYTVKYGLLYNYYVVTDERNITSVGDFVVPSWTNWETLLNYVDTYDEINEYWPLSAQKLKETGIEYWASPNEYATNEYGFNARGGGIRNGENTEGGGYFELFNEFSGLWLTSSDLPISGNNVYFDVTLPLNEYSSALCQEGLSIRLVRPATPAELEQEDGTACANYVQNNGVEIGTIKIGNQVWTSENSTETKFRDGSWITGFDDGVYTPISNETWGAATIAMCCAYDDDLTNAFIGSPAIDIVVTVENLRTTKYANGDPIVLAQPNNEWINAVGGAYCTFEPSPPQYIIEADVLGLNLATSQATITKALHASLGTGSIALSDADILILRRRLATLGAGELTSSLKPATITKQKNIGIDVGELDIVGKDVNIFTTTGGGDKPVIDTESMLFLSDNRVGVIAWITPNGTTTQLELQYGATTSYGSIITIDGLVGLTPVAIGEIIPRLNPGNYHYRIVAANSSGTTYGDDHPFTIYPGVGRDLIDYSTELDAAIADMDGSSYYVDPSSTDTVEDGTEAHPYHSWTSFASLGGNNRYYQKRGTTYNATTGTLRTISGNCFIGAYGAGSDYAYMTCVSSSFSTFIYAENGRVICKDLDIMGHRTGGIGTELGRGIRLSAPNSGDTMNHWVYNCKVHRFNRGVDSVLSGGWFSGYRVIKCEIYDTYIENIYPDGATNFEIAYCYLHNANNSWHVLHNSDAVGDNVQIAFNNSTFPETHLYAHIHHNTFDRTSSGHKFCLIWNEYMNAEEMHVYNNHFICPVNGTYSLPVSCIYTSDTYATTIDPCKSFIYNNIFEDGNYGLRNYTTAGTQVHHNLFLRQFIGIASGIGIDQNYYNNVFKDYMSVAIGISTGVVKSKNNVFDTSVTTAYAYSGPLSESDYNCFRGGRIATSAYGLIEWQSENPTRDQHSDGLDPLFADSDNADFTIQSGSSLDGTGVDVGLTEDFIGTEITVPVSKGIYQETI